MSPIALRSLVRNERVERVMSRVGAMLQPRVGASVLKHVGANPLTRVDANAFTTGSSRSFMHAGAMSPTCVDTRVRWTRTDAHRVRTDRIGFALTVIHLAPT